MTIDSLWSDRLKPLAERDLFIRDALLKRGVLTDTYHPEMEKVHLQNAKKLRDLITRDGFPVLSNAGAEGVRLSWLIIQHAISSPDFMRESVLQMRLAAAEGDYPLDLLAYTEDRIAFLEGSPQPYGTNVDWEDGELKPTKILEPERLELRREAMGLPPLQDVSRAPTMEKPPKDPDKKSAEFLRWLEKVGWRP